MVTPSEPPPTANRFLLRKGGRQAVGIVKLAPLAPLLLLLVLTRIPALVPFRTPVSLSLLIVDACLIAWMFLGSLPGSKPALALSIEGGIATLDRLQPPAPAIARAALTPGRIEHARWLPPRGKFSNPMFYNPMVCLTLDPVWRLEIGSPQPWAGTHGPSSRMPKYWIDDSAWPEFIAALTAACEANQRGPAPTR